MPTLQPKCNVVHGHLFSRKVDIISCWGRGGRGAGGLVLVLSPCFVVIEFPFVENEVCKVFDSHLMYGFHYIR